ncbi:MAG: hypothetical protein ACK5NN_09605 [Sphingomonadaceae bacterium]
MIIAHGTILGGLSTVPDLDNAIVAYRDVLQLELIERGVVDVALATSWGCPGNAGSPCAILRPTSGEGCWFRLVEQSAHPAFHANRSYGWAAFEVVVKNVWHWAEALPPDLFTIAGPPKNLKNMKPAFIPMQVLGTGQEMLYLNQVLGDLPETDLPRANADVDRIFIVILASADREASAAWYSKRIGLDRASDYTLPYSMINRAFDLPADYLSTITMMQSGRMPIVEIDDYPHEAVVRARFEGMLPPANALVTLAVRNLSDCDVDWIAPPAVHGGVMYEGRRAASTLGPSGELLELVEVG